MAKDGSRLRRLMEYLDDFPPATRAVAKSILAAELGKLHMQHVTHIKSEIRSIIEKEAMKEPTEEPPGEA
jgi:hypothetical protein